MLDREESASYQVKVKLNTLSAFANQERTLATVSPLHQGTLTEAGKVQYR
jgi:hypothetical protein